MGNREPSRILPFHLAFCVNTNTPEASTKEKIFLDSSALLFWISF